MISSNSRALQGMGPSMTVREQTTQEGTISSHQISCWDSFQTEFLSTQAPSVK